MVIMYHVLFTLFIIYKSREGVVYFGNLNVVSAYKEKIWQHK
jgi:hypothetical protein